MQSRLISLVSLIEWHAVHIAWHVRGLNNGGAGAVIERVDFDSLASAVSLPGTAHTTDQQQRSRKNDERTHEANPAEWRGIARALESVKV